MKKLFALIGVCLIATAVYAKPIRLMVFGDSLSAGHNLPVEDAFYSRLENALRNDGYDVSVINFSKSGETTAGGLAKTKQAIIQNPDAVLLELGINDLLHGLSLSDASKNLQAIINVFKKQNIPVLLVGMEAPALAPLPYKTAFRRMYSSLAKDNDLMLYPFFMEGLWKTNGEHKDVAYFLPDMLHPSAIGVQIITKNITPTVEKFIKKYFKDYK